MGIGLLAFVSFHGALSGRFFPESVMLPLANILVASSLHLKTLRGVMVHGFVLGLMALTRGNFILAIPVSLVVLIAGEYFATPSSGARMPFWTRCFVLGLTAVVVLVPYGVWNYQHHRQFSLTPLAGFARAMWSGAEQMGLPAASLPANTWEIHNSIWVERNPRPTPGIDYG